MTQRLNVGAFLFLLTSCSSSGSPPEGLGSGSGAGGATNQPGDASASDGAIVGTPDAFEDGGSGGGVIEAATGSADGRSQDGQGADSKDPPLARPWTTRTSPIEADLLSLASNGDVIVAAGTGGILHSTDGVTWEVASPPVAARRVAYGSGVFAAVGDRVAFVSSDGRAWTPAALPSGAAPYALAYGAGHFIASIGTGSAYIASSDGATWTQVFVPQAFQADWSNVLDMGGAKDFLFASKATLMASGNFSSRDGMNWTRLQQWGGVTYDIWFDGQVFCATGTTGQTYRSTDAASWTRGGIAEPTSLLGVASSGGVFFTVGPFGTVRASKDCVTWEQGSDPPQPTHDPRTSVGLRFNAIRPHKGRLVIAGNEGVILTSP